MSADVHRLTPEPDDRARADKASEVAVLGWLLDSPPLGDTAEVWSMLAPEDFYGAAHEQIARVAWRLFSDGVQPDPARVLQEFVSAGVLRLLGDAGGGYLHSLLQYRATGLGNVRYHVTRITDAARKRDLLLQLVRVQQRLEQPDAELLTVLQEHADEVQALQVTAAASVDLGLVDFTDFITQPADDVDFILPGLLARQEKVIITGAEGWGKSTLMRQFALSAAAGLHPFTHDVCEPRRVLWLDGENHPDANRRKMLPIYDAVLGQRRTILRGTLTLEHLSTFDLLNDRDVAWLTRAVTEARPDLVYLGPLYQVVGGSLNDEEVAQRVVRTLNRVCALADCAMMIEAHAGHGKGAGGTREWRPRGSSVLLGWPDFGFGLGLPDEPRPDIPRHAALHEWRGARHDDRHWPSELCAGGAFPWDGYE